MHLLIILICTDFFKKCNITYKCDVVETLLSMIKRKFFNKSNPDIVFMIILGF